MVLDNLQLEICSEFKSSLVTVPFVMLMECVLSRCDPALVVHWKQGLHSCRTNSIRHVNVY